MALRIGILDDEPLALEVLADYVQKTNGLVLIEATTDAYKILELVQQKSLDILLLDIQMPELNGIQVMKIIGQNCRIILTTAYAEYALDSYDFNVSDYLLKPIAYERFVKAIEKTRPLLASQPEGHAVAPIDHIFIKSEYKLIRVDLSDILYIESLRDYIAIHTLTNGKIMSLDSLRNMENQLPANRFTRVHKSYIIAINHISFIERNRIIIKDEYIPIGDSYQAAFANLIKAG